MTDHVTVTFQNMTGNPSDWIAIAIADTPDSSFVDSCANCKLVGGGSQCVCN
jgi:hypothetical protein